MSSQLDKRSESTLYATCRLFTGNTVARAYIRNRATGKPIWGCTHQHRGRLLGGWDANGRKYKNAEHYAMKCANQALKRLLEGHPI